VNLSDLAITIIPSIESTDLREVLPMNILATSPVERRVPEGLLIPRSREPQAHLCRCKIGGETRPEACNRPLAAGSNCRRSQDLRPSQLEQPSSVPTSPGGRPYSCLRLVWNLTKHFFSAGPRSTVALVGCFALGLPG